MGVNTKDKRAFTAGKWGCQLDGCDAGWLISWEGGQMTAEVITEKIAGSNTQAKHLGPPKCEDGKLTCGTGMSKSFYSWLKAALDHDYKRKNGAVIFSDFDHNEQGRLEFFHALPAEIGFPAVDASSKDAAKLNVTLAIQESKYIVGKGSKISMGKVSADQKKWTASNFRLRIDGIPDDCCSRVKKVEALAIKLKCVENQVGEFRIAEKEPASVEMPNVVISIPMSHADDFFKWHKDFVIDGNCTDDKEKGGSLTFLASDMKEELFTLKFEHLGIFKIGLEKLDAGGETIQSCKVEMYCENITWDEQKGIWG
jgi:hypothetical protein